MMKLLLSAAFAGLLLASSAGAQGPTITGIADITVTGAATVLRGANNARESLSCTNNDATVNIRVAGSNVTATRGQRVAAGATFKTESKGSVQAISEGANVAVSCTEETQ